MLSKQLSGRGTKIIPERYFDHESVHSSRLSFQYTWYGRVLFHGVALAYPYQIVTKFYPGPFHQVPYRAPFVISRILLTEYNSVRQNCILSVHRILDVTNGAP